MSIPDYQAIMLPLLKLAGDGREHTKREAEAEMARHFGLTEEERAQLLPSGRQRLFDNRVGWARTYLKQSGLLEAVRRGVFVITERGRAVLSRGLDKINVQTLEEFSEFQDFRSRARPAGQDDTSGLSGSTVETSSLTQTLTPDEQIRAGYRTLRANLAAELLERIQAASPAFFENLVVELLVAMGYGGSHEDAAAVVGRSGDGGIDGIIKEDRLGLESIHIQAKRWQDTRVVGRPEVQQFAGALQGQRARKGVFLTTSSFSHEAIDFAKSLQTTIVLVSGVQLAQLMLDHGIGVSVQQTIQLLKIDEDYFEGE
jgi:restriction system protein